LNVIDADHTPRVLPLREALQAFLDHRHDVLCRRTRHRLDKIAHRLEVLDGYLVAYLNLDEVIAIIREADDAKKALVKRFKLTDVQVEAILNMRLRALRKLEEIEIRKEHKTLSAEQTDLKDLMKKEARRWQVIGDEIRALRKTFGPDTALGARRTTIGKPPSDVVIPLEAVMEREPVTVLLSTKGWIRAMKGHLEDISAAKYKEGDRPGFVAHAMTTDKLLLFATNGRFYTLGVDKLPGGRGFGEPLRLLFELPNDQDIIGFFVYQPGEKLLVASQDGRGFVVPQDEVVGQTKNGKLALNLGEGQEAAACARVDGDHVAVIGDNRKLLIFPLEELPEMTRGRGVILQRYKDGGLSDIKTFFLEDGLTWSAGAGRVRTETDLVAWIGKRGQSGRLPPTGFPRSNKFA
jgi:topoisomerase-4 subunit A